jgi:drug/metabolite transporter (DMT)-like permease
MELHVFLAVLGAAMMHAGWNAVVKGGADPFTSVTQVSLFSGAIALCLLPIVNAPATEAWPWLAASAGLHTLYRFMLIGAYRAGDMAQVYPIMRGAAPLMTMLATALLIGERASAVGMAAVAALSLGVFLMSLRGGRVGRFEGRAVAMALLSAASTCGYTLTDGIGARVNGSGPAYALWMFVLNAATMQSIAFTMRGWKAYDGLQTLWPMMAGGGAMSMSAYFIVIWAMTQAPIALVAALRETSVLFGSLIAMVFLKEAMTSWRALASAFVLLGMALLKLA